MKKNSQTRKVDPALLFQRFLRICQTQDISEETLFQYELSSHPTPLFDDDDRMLLTDKPELAKCIEKNLVIDSCCVIVDTNFRDAGRPISLYYF